MKSTQTAVILLPTLLALVACGGGGEAHDVEGIGEAAQALSVTNTQLTTFQQPEVVPNVAVSNPEGVSGSNGQLKRKSGELSATLNPKDLPEGAYTFWWHITHLDGEESILFATSAIVGSNGNTHVTSTLPEGEENAPGLIFTGHGLQEGGAETANAEIFVRYHGAPATDPELLEAQLSHPFGGCTAVPESLNPNPLPSDYPCWNPQIAQFGSP